MIGTCDSKEVFSMLIFTIIASELGVPNVLEVSLCIIVIYYRYEQSRDVKMHTVKELVYLAVFTYNQCKAYFVFLPPEAECYAEWAEQSGPLYSLVRY